MRKVLSEKIKTTSIGLLPCDTEMDRSLHLLCCWSHSYRYSLFGGDLGGDDRWLEREDKRDLR